MVATMICHWTDPVPCLKRIYARNVDQGAQVYLNHLRSVHVHDGDFEGVTVEVVKTGTVHR